MSLLRALATISSMTLLSRILGFVRDFVIARAFGAGVVTDAFFVAFRLPNLLRRMFAEGAFSQAFVPILGEYRNRRGQDETRVLVNHVASALLLLLVGVTLVGMLATPAIIWISAPGFADDPEKFELTVRLTRICFPYILLISLVALAAGVLNTWSRFAVPAFTPVLLNVSFIVFALYGAQWFDPPIMALAWAVVAGGIAQLALQVPALQRLGMLPRFSLNLKDPGVRRIFRQMGPAILGVSVTQISLLINTIFASFLPTGSVSWLYYADRLMEFPAGLLGSALGTILLPSLSKLHATDARDEYSALLDWGLRLTLLLSLPAAVALAILGLPLIATLFHHGAFSDVDAWRTQEAVLAYSLGLTGLLLVKVLAPGFYAKQDIRTPVKIGLLTLGVTQLMNLAFILPFQHAGLALATGLASWVNAGLLLRGLLGRGVYRPQAGWRPFLLKLGVALAVLGGSTWALAFWGDANWLSMGGLERVIRLSAVVGGGMACYFGTLWLLGFRVSDFKRRAA